MGSNITHRECKLKVALNDGQIYFHSLDQNWAEVEEHCRRSNYIPCIWLVLQNA